MGAFLIKDILVVLRNRADLLILLAMPFLLIAIMGFSLRGLLGGDTEALNIQVALVQQDDEAAGIAQFREELSSMELPERAAESMGEAAEEVSPYTLLRNMLQDESLRGLIHVHEMDAAAAGQALEDEEVAAVLTIPEAFTYEALRKMLSGAGEGGELQLTVIDTTSVQANVFEGIIREFTNALNFETALARALAEEGLRPAEELQPLELGGLLTVSERKPLGSFQYYTIGMAVMFILFTAATTAGGANVERQQHVFNRILLSGRHPFVYLSAKAFSTAIIGFCQLSILFILSAVIFGSFRGESLAFWLGMALISVILSVCIGGLGALLTALTVRFKNDAVATIFAGGFVTIFAFLGGSFMPVGELPEVIRQLGAWTPNGVALSAYLSWIQQLDLSALLGLLSRLAAGGLLLLSLGMLIFPKRGAV